MKVGFIGFGKSANRYHLPFVDKVKDLEVVGYYKPGKNVFEMLYPLDYEIKSFDSEKELYSNCDLVIVTTPPKYHFDYAKNAILSGNHVLVEKPFCETSEDAKYLFDLAKQNNVVICAYQNRRYDSDFLTIKEIISKYDIGTIMEIESNHTHYRTDRSAEEGTIYDGAVFGHAVHFLDQIVSLYGEPDDVIYDTTSQKAYFMDKVDITKVPEDYYDIKLVYNEVRIRVRFSQMIVSEPPRWIINTDKVTVNKYHIDQQERDLKKGIFLDNENFGVDLDNSEATIYHLNGEVEKVGTVYKGYTKFYEDLIGYINKQNEKPVKDEEVLTVLNIMETIVNKKRYQKLNLLKG